MFIKINPPHLFVIPPTNTIRRKTKDEIGLTKEQDMGNNYVATIFYRKEQKKYCVFASNP